MLILKVSGSRKEVFWKTRKHIVLQTESWAEIKKRPKDQKERGWASVKALKQEAALSITEAKRMPGAGKLYTKKKIPMKQDVPGEWGWEQTHRA